MKKLIFLLISVIFLFLLLAVAQAAATPSAADHIHVSSFDAMIAEKIA